MRVTLERLLQSQGFGSRRECRRLVRKGGFAIGGQTRVDPFEQIETDEIEHLTVRGEPWRFREQVYIALHKPAGYECSRKPSHHPSIFELLPQPFSTRGVQPVGRLDHDSSGLLLMSDDGAFVHTVSSPRRRVSKRYHVQTEAAVTEALVQTLQQGVLLRGEQRPLAAIDCLALGTHQLELEVDQGKYHQVKRMVAAAGNRVAKLERVAIGALRLADLALAPGQFCDLEPAQRQLVVASRGDGSHDEVRER